LGEQLSLLTDELEKTKSDSETTAAEKQQALDNANKEIVDLKKKIKDQKKKHKDELNEKGSEILMLKEQHESGNLTDKQSEEIRKQVEDKLKAEYDERIKAAEDKMKSLEKKMHSADQSESRAALKVYFEETQKNLSTFLAKVNSLDDEAVKEKFLTGAVKWLEAVVAELKGM
ncbi:MAG: hypothetical protein IJ723_01945, partial [Ruminococcus sp.]|nr:hypothetical protein [Ruminococcus sp.]